MILSTYTIECRHSIALSAAMARRDPASSKSPCCSAPPGWGPAGIPDERRPPKLSPERRPHEPLNGWKMDGKWMEIAESNPNESNQISQGIWHRKQCQGCFFHHILNHTWRWPSITLQRRKPIFQKHSRIRVVHISTHRIHVWYIC